MQLLNKAEQDMKNSADQGGCYSLETPFEVCRILHILPKLNLIIALLFIQNKEENELFVFLLNKNDTTSSRSTIQNRIA